MLITLLIYLLIFKNIIPIPTINYTIPYHPWQAAIGSAYLGFDEF